MILSLDGTQPQLSWCLRHNDTLLFSENVKLSHYEKLPEHLQKAFETQGISPADISRLAVIVGPGNYTGLRTSLAFVRTWHLLHQTPVVCKNRLETMVYAANQNAPTTPVWISQFVRMQQYFIARGHYTSDGIKWLVDPVKVKQEEWYQRVEGEVCGDLPPEHGAIALHTDIWNHLSPTLAEWAQHTHDYRILHDIVPLYTRAAVNL